MNLDSFKHYKTDIEEIDNQHLNILTKAYDIVKFKNIPVTQLLEKINELEIIFNEHLIYEEQFMVSINYKYLISHCEMHVKLRNNFKEIMNNLKNTNYEKRHLIDKLDKMFLDHVDHDDLQYADYYKKLNKPT